MHYTLGLREALLKFMLEAFGHCPEGGGGSQPLPGWFGVTFLGGICLILGGDLDYIRGPDFD